MTFAPEGWSVLMQGIADWLRLAVPTGVTWGWADDPDRPEMTTRYVLARWVNPPSHRFFGATKKKQDAIRINTAAVQTYTINLIGGPVSYAAQVGDTIQDIRDALLVQIAGASSLGIDTIVIPIAFQLDSDAPVTPEPDIRPKILLRQESRGQGTLQIDAYADRSEDAAQLSVIMSASIEMVQHRETLNNAGWGVVRISQTRSLPELVTGARRGRANFDVVLSCRFEMNEIVDYIMRAPLSSLTIADGEVNGEISG